MPNPGSGACEVLFNVSHREINFERLTCCQFAQLLTQMRQLVGVIFSYAGSVLKAIAARLHARGIKIVPEFAYRMPDQFKQPDKIHLTAEGHKRLATPLLPFVIKALTPT
jgi:lysophospholipase L1-like esterase